MTALASCCPFPFGHHHYSSSLSSGQYRWTGNPTVLLMKGLSPWYHFLPPSSAYLPFSYMFRSPTVWPVSIGNIWGTLKMVVPVFSSLGSTTVLLLNLSALLQLWQNLGMRHQALLLYAPSRISHSLGTLSFSLKMMITAKVMISPLLPWGDKE